MLLGWKKSVVLLITSSVCSVMAGSLSNGFAYDMLDLDLPEAERDTLFIGGKIERVQTQDTIVRCEVPYEAQRRMPGFEYKPAIDDGRVNRYPLEIKAYGDRIIRVRTAYDASAMSDEGPMLLLSPSLKPLSLEVNELDAGWSIGSHGGRKLVEIDQKPYAKGEWRGDRNLKFPEQIRLSVYPNPDTKVELVHMDSFNSMILESVGLGFMMRDGKPDRATFSVYCDQDEMFAGTGERFCSVNLRGQLLQLENTDGRGTNSRRTYKNVPMFLSSRGYAIFMHTSSHVKLSLAAVSGNSVSAMIEEPVVDLFVIGGDSVAEILKNYCRLTGFVPELPLWSYGVWMSRVTYLSEEEVREVASTMRERKHPCDVLHIDTGWFEEDWICDWKFGSRFPEPKQFLSDMQQLNYHVTLWQTPYIRKQSSVAQEAKELGYLGDHSADAAFSGSDWGNGRNAGHIDFSNPDAVKWYQEKLADLFDLGASAIKTDFGEDVMPAKYNMPYARFHNLYSVLYQKAAFEITKEKTGEGIIWARAGWAGAQRYPVHWGGDAQGSWNGMLSSIKGALNLGLGGFAYWSSDIPGFYGYPVAFKSKPSDALYMRWTQFGVFNSHMRYHGQWPREPWEYPEIEDTVRSWLNLRYMLIPYLVKQSEVAAQTGLPIMRSLIIHHADDPMCWHINDEYYFGDDLLIAPIANDEGVRDVYLPEGDWVDFWSGEAMPGGQWLKQVEMPLSKIPIYVRKGAALPVYPEVVQSTAEMDMKKVTELSFDDSYQGFAASPLAKSGIEE